MKSVDGLCQAILVSGFLVLALMFAANAPAADRDPCSEDIAKFCRDAEPSQLAVIECLEQHEAQLSEACKDYETRMGGPRTEPGERVRQLMRVRRTCSEDIAKFCWDATPASGGIPACLKQHTNEVSSFCRDAIEAAAEEERKTQ